MAIITTTVAIDMSLSDPLGLGSYSTPQTDFLNFITLSNDASNYTTFTGNLSVLTNGVKVVNGVTTFTYSGGNVSLFDAYNNYVAAQYDAIMSLFLAGSDRVTGSGFDDVLEGRAGNDVIHGRGGRDTVDGGDGADRLFGDSGSDTVLGRAGNDILRGGVGRDTLTGGSGRDKFFFDTALSSTNFDTITDFKHGTDKIVLDHTVFAAFGASELFISEYVEGSGFNKAIEIFNGTGSAVDLAAGGYSLELYSNGSATPTATLALTGVVASGDAFVLANAGADALILAVTDVQNGTVINFNGDDAVVLRKGGAIIDVIGQIAVDPGTEWTANGVSTLDQTLRRLPTILAGDTDGSNSFDPSLEWQSYATNTFDGLGSHRPTYGPLPFSAFTTAAPATPDEHIIYDSVTGKLFYDDDGSGPNAAVLFAKVNPGTALTFDDFTVV